MDSGPAQCPALNEPGWVQEWRDEDRVYLTEKRQGGKCQLTDCCYPSSTTGYYANCDAYPEFGPYNTYGQNTRGYLCKLFRYSFIQRAIPTPH